MFLQGWKEWSWAGLGIVLLGTFFSIANLHRAPEIQVQTVAEGSYTMARVHNDFLEQREELRDRVQARVQRQAYRQNSVAPTQIAGTVTVAKPAAAKVDPKKTAKAEKVDPKKKAAEDRKKAVAAAKAKAKKEHEKQMALRVIDASKRFNSMSESAPEVAAKTDVVPQGVAFNPSKNPAANKEQDVNQDDKMSPGQWYSLLQAQPTAANALRFYKQKNNLGAASYYAIVTKLLEDSQADRQKLAVYLLKSDVSLGSFQYLAKLPDQVLKNNALNAQLQTILKTYGQEKARFGILAAALSSSDAAVVLESQALISEAVQNIGSTGSVSVSSTGNSASSASLTKNDFTVFKTGLARLIRSNNEQVALQARSLYQSLWQDLGSQVASN